MKISLLMRPTLPLKVAIATVMAIAALAGVLVVFYNQETEQAGYSGLMRRAVTLASALANESEFGLLAGNKPLLERLAQNALLQEDVVCARIYNDEGRLMAKAGQHHGHENESLDAAMMAHLQRQFFSDYLTDPELGLRLVVNMPVRLRPASVSIEEPFSDEMPGQSKPQAGRLLGVVHLAVNPASTIEHTEAAQRTALLIALVCTVTISALSGFMVRRMVQPLQALAAVAKQLESGNLAARVTVASRDEIGELARAFNDMAQSLQQSREEILSHQRNLERRVQERTAELQESRDFFNAVFAESPLAILILDAQGRAQLFNKAFRALFRVPAGQPAAEAYNIFDDPERKSQAPPERLAQVFQLGQTLSLTLEYDARNVNRLWAPPVRPQVLSFTLFPLKDNAGQVKNVVVIIEDLTQQRQIEAQLRQAEKMAAVGQLGAGVAHELNNPLASILGYTQILLKRAPADHPFRASLEIIEQESLRCKNIILNMLAYSRPAGQNMSLEDLRAIIERTLALMRNQAAIRNVQMDLAYDTAIPRLRLNANQMQQVLVNIIANAFDVMPQGGRIFIACALDSERRRVILKVGDTGHGIAAEHLPRLFEPFFTTKEHWRGTGLGLAVCYKIVQDHGGRIYARNRTGGGAEFVIELPVPDNEAA
ncbi:MAG: ATP-binding protein [Verrucomicrobiae bacterium]|nr:ATP-binding protein [Verrucomicrobiae bacterium]